MDAPREADLFAKRGGTEIATLTARCASFGKMSAASAGTRRLPRWAIYCLIAVAASGPLLLEWLSGDYDLVQRLAETPVVVGLVAFVVKILLDANERVQERAEDRHREDREDAQRRHEAERAVLTQQLEHAFAVGSSSHMANVAFDKHVKFCEDYAEELRRTIGTLIAHVTTTKALDHAAALTLLRQKQALWLTEEMEVPLETIESALRRIGAGHNRCEVDHSMSYDERMAIHRELHKLFADLVGTKVLGPFPDGEHFNEEMAIGNVIRGLGRILGVDELTRLRRKILNNAATSTSRIAPGT